jgi:hypothetical protein
MLELVKLLAPLLGSIAAIALFLWGEEMRAGLKRRSNIRRRRKHPLVMHAPMNDIRLRRQGETRRWP